MATRNPSHPTVLVVDDEALIRWALCEGLTEAGYLVEVAATGAEAKAALVESDDPHVVLLDLRLPDVSDLSLLSEIRRRWPEAPVVVMTAHGTPQDAADASRLGVFRVVGKPFDVTEIVHLVDEAWRQRAQHPPV
jgi:DNA-binding NtrC family response regulator